MAGDIEQVLEALGSDTPDSPAAPAPTTEYGWSFEETERRQLLAGLAMTPLERLRWLDRRKKELQGLLGRAAGADEAPP